MQLNYHLQGASDQNNTPVVLLHGLFGSLENLNVIARPLQQHTQVLAIDLPNHGRSPHCDTLDYPMMAEQVLALLNQLKFDKVNLLGHSMGAKVAMHLALNHHDKVEKLIVADMAPVQYSPKHNDVLDALNAIDLTTVKTRKQADEQLAQYIEELGVRQFLLKSLAPNSDKTDDKNAMQWRFNLKAISENYQALTLGFDEHLQYKGPTLFIKGELSGYIQAKHRPTIAKLFPNSRGHVVNDAGHWLHAQKPEQFNRIVNGFFLA